MTRRSSAMRRCWQTQWTFEGLPVQLLGARRPPWLVEVDGARQPIKAQLGPPRPAIPAPIRLTSTSCGMDGDRTRVPLPIGSGSWVTIVRTNRHGGSMATILRVALVTPLTGPLARFGRAGATALDVWARQAARLPAGWRGVKLKVHDAHPNPAEAMRASTASHLDIIFGPYGSSPTVAAAAATDRMVWNHGGATSQLDRPRFPRVVNVPSPASTYFRGSLQAVRAADPDA